MKWKIAPQLRWARNSPICRAAWAKGQKVHKLIGFEATEGYRQEKASGKAHAGKGCPDGDKYEIEYPLMDLGWEPNRPGLSNDRGKLHSHCGGVLPFFVSPYFSRRFFTQRSTNVARS